jgi:hypothetical protein
MSGESPLSMMRSAGPRLGNRRTGRGWRRPGLIVAAVAIIIALALLWTWLWYYAASVADAALSGWVEREAAAGRVYGCTTQTIGGFPLRIEARCANPVAEIRKSQPQFTVRAENVTFAAEVYHPTLLTGEVTGPLTLAESGKPPAFLANWSRARVRVHGRPPDPDDIAFILDAPRLERASAAGGNGTVLFEAKHADLQGRIVSGSARDNPIIEIVLHLAAATAPTLHPLAGEPIEMELDATLRGFKDLSPKTWAEHFREMQVAGGGVDVKFLRVSRSDAIVVGKGAVSLNAHGKLDGLINVAIVGIDHIVPLLGVDRMIGRGIDRLAGSDSASQGLTALDKLMPGLGGALRDTANASLVDNLKKMGQPTEIDKKPAIVLPLRFSDGLIYLGMVPVGEVPPLF